MDYFSNFQNLIIGIILILLIGTLFIFMLVKESLFSLKRVNIRFLRIHRKKCYKKTLFMLKNDNKFFIIYNVFVQILFISIILVMNFFFNEYFRKNINNWYIEAFIKIIVFGIFLIIVIDLLPKLIATKRYNAPISFFINFVFFFFKICFKLSNLILKFDNLIKHEKFSHKGIKDKPQILKLINESKHYQPIEKKMLKGIADLSNKTIKQIMKVKIDLVALNFNLNFENLIKDILNYKYSRFPVYENSLNEIVGMLHTKDILPYLNDIDFNWHTLIKPAFYIHENKKLEELMIQFQEQGIQFAIVINEFGETEGIVTLEDVLEEIVGDIQDEFDEIGNQEIIQITDKTFIIDGKMQIVDVEKYLNINLLGLLTSNSDVFTIAGFLIDVLQDIPKINTTYNIANIGIFTILELSGYRISKIKFQFY